MSTTFINPIAVRQRRERQRAKFKRATRNMRYFHFGVNYNNSPDVYEYYFRAVSAEDVSKATGVDIEYISPASMADISAAIKHRKHIDTVINGQLVDVED